MKTIQPNRLACYAALAVASTLLLALPPRVNADAPNTAKGGALLQQFARPASPKEASKIKVMNCPNCRGEVVAVRDTAAKGGAALLMGGAAVKTQTQHLCPACGTQWSVVGDGKAKQNVAVHTCPNCG